MSLEERRQRFEELDAGRALGDLDAAESAELLKLTAELGLKLDLQLDLLAAELEAGPPSALPAMMPASLGDRLRDNLPAQADLAEPTPHRNIVLGPWLGWAAAACLLALLTIPKMLPEPDIGDRQAKLIKEADDLRRLPFAGASDLYRSASGEVVWSDTLQEGYMTLVNLPKNDPKHRQYQLWIIDPVRDEFPVDGGVFDIPTGDGPVIVQIDAKLAIKNPAAFVITLEQPGGVVRSKQEVVVALAKS